MKQVEVVAAIIHDAECRIFATQRGYGDWKDYWEFPGGKIEPGESPEEALKREIWEELETRVVVERFMQTIEYDYPDFHLTMHCYWCRIERGSLTLKEHESAVWLKLDELDGLSWLPADKEILGALTTESLQKGQNKVCDVNKESQDQEKWQWQEPGTVWKGVGLYHITLTIPDRQPLLGNLDIPDNDPSKAKVVRTALGNALVNCLLSIPTCHPEVQVFHFCLMPDHLHAVLYVRHTMPKGIGSLVRGFWQAVKKLGRVWSATSFATSSSVTPNAIRGKSQEADEQGKSLRENTKQLENLAAGLRERMGDEAYYRLKPVFTEMPFIRPMWRRIQLQNTIRYIDMNPQRLATKRIKPGFFRVQREIVIGRRTYDGVGNTKLLMAEHFEVVHVRRKMVEKAKSGNDSPLRDYMNSCILKARKGTVMISPFISPHEKQVMQVLLHEQLPFILLTNNGFSDYYKPADAIFDACASGHVLILSPWQFDANKRHINREECVALNQMAEEITSL